MPLKQIASARFPFVNSKGIPVAGGYITVKEPGGSDDVPVYRSAARSSTHTPPNIGLSGSGRLTAWVNQDCDVRVYDKNDNLVSEDLGINPTVDGTEATGGLIVNGSFETDDDSDTVPDSWTLNSEAGSTNAIDSSVSSDGAQSFRFTSSGSGGGDLTTTNFFEVNESEDLRVRFDIRSTLAALHHRVRIQWYDITQAFISNTDVYDSTSNPTSFTEQNTVGTPPSGARFAKLQLFGCISDVATPGSVYFDRVSAYYPVAISGVFDNITIQNSEIITTNANGDLAITPNGTGAANVGSGGTVDLADAKNDLNIGSADPASDPHMAFDPDSIQAKSDGTNATDMSIQSLGGNLLIGPQSGIGHVRAYDDGDLVFTTEPAGFAAVGSTTGTAALGTASDAGILFYNADQVGTPADAHGFLGYASNRLEVRNNANNAAIDIYGVASSSEVLMGRFNPANDVELYYQGDKKFETEPDGISIFGAGTNDPAAGSNQDVDMDFRNASNAVVASIGYVLNSTDFLVDLNVHGGSFHVRGEDNTGDIKVMINADPDLYVDLYYDGSLKYRTSRHGGEVHGDSSNTPESGGVQNTYLKWQNGSSQDLGNLGFAESSTVYEFVSLLHGGTFECAGEDAAGVEQTIWTGDPDGPFEAFHDGGAVPSIATSTLGMDVTSPTDDNPRLGFYQDDGTTQNAYLEAHGINGVELRGLVHGAPITFSAENAGGTPVDLLILDPDSTSVQLLEAGTAVARTVGAASGGLEANNTNTGAGFERVLTESDLGGTNDTFTPTWTGFSSDPSGALNYSILGNFCSIYCTANRLGTSNSSSFSLSGVPAAARPDQDRQCMLKMTDDGNAIYGAAIVSSAGAITFLAADGTGQLSSIGFTNTGSKGWPTGINIIYPLS